MFFVHKGFLAVLLLVSAQSIVLASFEDDKKEAEVMAEMIIRFVKVPWIDRVHSVILPFDNSCATELAALIKAVKSGEMWALQMLDASSKIPSGILRGNTHDLGMYNECVEASGQYNDIKIRGKHCTVSIGTGSKDSVNVFSKAISSFSSSLCVPSSCNETQIDDIINAVLQRASIPSRFGLKASPTSCVQIGSEDFSTGEILTIAFFLTIGVFLTFCTICDFAKRARSGDACVAVNEFAKFSLYTNAIALLSMKRHPQTMPAIQGIRFLSMCWVVLGHRYFTSIMRPMVNLLEIRDWLDSWAATYIQTAPFAVDTFFVISGFLMTYLFLKYKQSGKRSNFLMMYLHRYLRLTPCLAVLILFVVFLLHRVASNGLARETLIATIVNPCRKNWWVNLFYAQNFFDVDHMCLPHSWYLAVDMQLFWISPIILYPLNRWPKYGLGILSAFLLASVITPAVILTVNGYSTAAIRFDISQERITGAFQNYYIPTYNRACAYFVGILLGHDVANNKRRHISKVNIAINWAVAFILMLFCWWATHHINNSNFPYNIVLESAFAVLLRPSWSIGIAWLVYACTQGYGGLVTRFLSLPIFLPLSRLSYCIYLVHMVIQVVKNVAKQNPGIFGDFEMLNDFWGDLWLSIPVAFVLSLFFESPVIVLEKMIRNRSQKSEKPIIVQETKKDVEMGIRNEAMTKD